MTRARDRVSAWRIGCDVGSTAVKLVVCAPGENRITQRWYERHGTRQAAAVERLLARLVAGAPAPVAAAEIAWTGSGGRALADAAGGPYVQEVNAVAQAVEALHPGTGSIVDLGGQDAKIIRWQDEGPRGRRKFFSMNDKCAGGTGAVIDRIAAKLGYSCAALQAVRTANCRLHPVAARCGVFAETDINGLQKQGIERRELIASLFEAIVQQNLSVLARGATLPPPVLLLGGPHAFLPGLVERWRAALIELWRERGEPLPADPEGAVRVPPDACQLAALGAVLHAAARDPRDSGTAPVSAVEALARLQARQRAQLEERGLPGLLADPEERAALTAMARQSPALGLQGPAGRPLVAWIGLDAGSTSTKAVLLDRHGRLRARAYQLSEGDPLADARAVLTALTDEALQAGRTLEVAGFGVTGYAKDMLGALLGADLALVETVAHARSALRVAPDCDVIVDVGGQDIKVLVLRDGRVRDFRLNGQCSAGNGFFLQSTAQRFGIPLDAYADYALSARRCPAFHFGCAVFLEADIVNFQQLGWQPEEILAGLARVLPKNIWLYVVGESNLARLGRRFLLQGGTQRNLAAVKAQADYIRSRVPAADVRVHPHAGEAGAIGVALELLAREPHAGPSRFIGLPALAAMRVRHRQDATTRCDGCTNRCARTFLEATLPDGRRRRHIIAPCEQGREAHRGAQAGSALVGERDGAARGRTPAGEGAATDWGAPPAVAENFAARSQRAIFSRRPRGPVGGAGRSAQGGARAARWRRPSAARRRRATVRIGLPRALDLHQTAPFFLGYLHAIGLKREQIHFSGRSTEQLFRQGARRGAIDTCYPAKLALAHVDDLVRRRTVDWIFFPALVNLPQDVQPAVASAGCPCAQATPDVVRAAYTRERDDLARAGMRLLTPVLHAGEPHLLAREMHALWGPLLDVTRRENAAALTQATAAQAAALAEVRRAAHQAITRLERTGQVGIVVLGRPYHDDPGLNHGILRDLQRRGYTILTALALPRAPQFWEPLFGREIAAGLIRGPFDIGDVWRDSFCSNSNQKVWAAKIVARHAHLVALDVSSFRCGHDAPLYATIEAILEAAATPYFTLHDVDENRPAGAIRLRVETIDYFLREFERRRLGRRGAESRPVPQAPAAVELPIGGGVLV